VYTAPSVFVYQISRGAVADGSCSCTQGQLEGLAAEVGAQKGVRNSRIDAWKAEDDRWRASIEVCPCECLATALE
jgi:hypothetical protein